MPSGVGGPTGNPGPSVQPLTGYVWTYDGLRWLAAPPGSSISGLTTARIVRAASATTIDSPAAIATDQTIATSDATPGTSITTASIKTLGGFAASAYSYLFGISSAVVNATVSTINHIFSQTITPPSDTTDNYNGVLFQCDSASGSTTNFTNATFGLVGAAGKTYHRGTGTVTAMRSLSVEWGCLNASGVVTLVSGIWIRTPTVTGTITTQIGLDIQNISGAGTNYSIRTGSGQVSIGDTADSTSTTTGSLIAAGGIASAKRITVDGTHGQTLKYVNGVANGAVGVVLGLVGPTGSTAGNPQGWIRIDVGGTDQYIPYW